MLNNLNLSHVLFIDIETVPQHPDWDEVDEKSKELWDKKAASLKRSEEDTIETLYQKAGIYAEFGKIICISVGILHGHHPCMEFRVKSFAGHDEKRLLENFSQLLNDKFSLKHHLLCAHNGKEFDYPYIARRMLINGIKLPTILNIAGKKPWEIQHLDTLELWKFGDYKSYTSLNLLAHVFNIPTPKDDIDGSQVASVYYTEDNLSRIQKYCEKDTLTVAQILLKYMGLPLVNNENIIQLS